MSKLNLTSPTSGYNTAVTEQANNDAIVAAIDNTLSRDGTSPNQMNIDLDMNSNEVMNLGPPTTNNSAIRLIDVVSGVPTTWVQTQAEITAGVTPVNTIYQQGDVRRYGVIGDGIVDDTVALNNALKVPGPTTVHPSLRILVDSGNIVIPLRSSLIGPVLNPGQILPHLQATYNSLQGCIILNSAYTIILGSNTATQGGSAALLQLYILRKGLLLPTSAGDCDTVLAAYAGTAVTLGNGTANHESDCYVGQCHILGFALAINGTTGCGRYTIERVTGDCTAGIYTIGSLDISRMYGCHFWDFITVNFNTKSNRAGASYYLDSPNDWTEVINCFSYGYQYGFRVNASSTRLIGCQVDGNSSTMPTNSIGFSIENVGLDNMLIGCESASHGLGYSCTTTGGTQLVACSAWGAGAAGNGPQYHIYVNNGRLTVLGGNYYGSPFAGSVSIDSATARYNFTQAVFDPGAVPVFTYAGTTKYAGDVDYGNVYVSGTVSTDTNRTVTIKGDILDNRYTIGANGAPGITFNTALGTTAVPVILGASTSMGIVRFYGHDGNIFQQAGNIRYATDGTPAAGSMPGKFIIATTPGGSVTPVDQWVVDNVGNFRPSVTGATTATGGFIYTVAAAGIPTGVPSFTTNGVPQYYDKTGLQLYTYSGANWMATPSGTPSNTQNTAYTTVMSDAGKTLFHTDGTARTYTIDSNANVPYPIGTEIKVINDASGAVNVTIAITSDTLVLAGPGTTGSRTLAQFGACLLKKVTATRWYAINLGGLT